MAAQIACGQRSERHFGYASTYPVAYAKIIRWPEEITLNETFEKVKEEAISAVVDAGDGTLKDVFESGDDETEPRGRGADSVDAVLGGCRISRVPF
jgi:hypothetical protein